MAFQILPAIDLIDGRCVRLYKGSYDQVTEYAKSPWNQAEIFEHEGGDVLHVVDLDGAKTGEPTNLPTIKKIREHVKMPIEVGGGIRSRDAAARLFTVGVNRVIVGTAAVEQPELLQELLKEFGSEKIVVGLDARESGTKIATRGWETKTELDVVDFALELKERGVTRIAYTDIARDGTLTYPNFEMLERLVQMTGIAVIASGGVTKLEHIALLKKIGCEGAILGKALYEHHLTVTEIQAANHDV